MANPIVAFLFVLSLVFLYYASKLPAARDAHESTLAWGATHMARAAGRSVRTVGRRLRSDRS